jgi:hypothetical protein
MFRNSDSDNDIEAGHTCNGRAFREVHLTNLFKQNYEEEGFYSGEEADLTDKEHLEPAGIGKGKLKSFVEMRQRLQ